jgi:hypothetical protein
MEALNVFAYKHGLLKKFALLVKRKPSSSTGGFFYEG